jgi:hypothetical protein
MVDPMASQIATLLTESDLKELEEVVRRWILEAPDDAMKHHYTQFGAKLLEFKRQMSSLPALPRREELEVAISMMLKLAAQRR